MPSECLSDHEPPSQDELHAVTRTSLVITSLIACLSGSLLLRRAILCGLFTDELLFLHALKSGISESLMSAGSSHPPLMRLIISAFVDPSTASDWQLRLPGVVLATAGVFVWQRIIVRLVDSTLVSYCLLAAMALNPFWLSQAFQCLPYAALTALTSLHCWAWLRYAEQLRKSTARKSTTSIAWSLVVTGALLPWTHFYGVWILVASQLIWLLLIRNRRTDCRSWIATNLVLAVLTLPTVPIACYYITTDGPYPLVTISDYSAYFLPISSYCFSTITFPGLVSTAPLFVPLYAAVVAYLWNSGLLSGRSPHLRHDYHLIAIGFFVGGFVAIQGFGLITNSGMWPRYMLASWWIHLPVIVLLLHHYAQRPLAAGLSVFCCLFAFIQLPHLWAFSDATDYQAVARHLETHHQSGDAFLVQSMDLWADENHFDYLWLERYSNAKLETVSGPHQLRSKLVEGGLSLQTLPPSIERVWVFSHLFKADWLRHCETPEWRLAELKQFEGAYPLALFSRSESAVHSDSQRTDAVAGHRVTFLTQSEVRQ